MPTKKELEIEVNFLRKKLAEKESNHQVVDLIYPNVESLAQWDELKYSVRSLVNLTGIAYRLWVVGDKPTWVNDQANFIPVEYTGSTPRIDILHKHLAVINQPEINEEYIWMNDDIYLVNKVIYADLCLPVAHNDLQSMIPQLCTQTVWGRDNIRTYELLQKEGLSTWNYGVHIPHRFEKSKVKLLIEKYNMLETPLVLEQLYYNYWFSDFTPYQNTLNLKNNQGFCVNRQAPNWDMFDKQLEVKKYMNHSEAGLSTELKRRIKKMFPKPSIFEKPV